MLAQRQEMLEHIVKSAGELYLGSTSSISSGNWYARDLRAYADYEKSIDHGSPMCNMLIRRADVTEVEVATLFYIDVLEIIINFSFSF